MSLAWLSRNSEADKIKRLEQARIKRAEDVRLLEAFQSQEFTTCWKTITEHLLEEKATIQKAIESKMGNDINADFMLGRLQTVDRLMSLPSEIRDARVLALEDAIRRIDEMISKTKAKVALSQEP